MRRLQDAFFQGMYGNFSMFITIPLSIPSAITAPGLVVLKVRIFFLRQNTRHGQEDKRRFFLCRVAFAEAAFTVREAIFFAGDLLCRFAVCYAIFFAWHQVVQAAAAVFTGKAIESAGIEVRYHYFADVHAATFIRSAIPTIQTHASP